MKQVGKRLAAWMLCICMLVGMPLSVSAEESFEVSHIVEMPDWMAVKGPVVGGTVDTNAQGRTLLVYFNSDPTTAPPSDWRYFISIHANGSSDLESFVWAKYNDSYVFPKNNPIAITLMTQKEANDSGYNNSANRGYDGTIQEYFAEKTAGKNGRTLHAVIADDYRNLGEEWDGFLQGNFKNANGTKLKGNRPRQNGYNHLTPALEEALTLDEAIILNDSTLKVKFSQDIDLSKLNKADGFTMNLAITNPNNDYIGPKWPSTEVSAMGDGWYKVSFATGDVRAAQTKLAEIHNGYTDSDGNPVSGRTDRKLVFFVNDEKEKSNFMLESVVSTESGMSLIASQKNKQWTDPDFACGLRGDIAVCELTERSADELVTLKSAYQLGDSTVLAQFSEPVDVSGLGSTFNTSLRITNNKGDLLSSGNSAELDGHWGSPVEGVSKYYTKTATKIEPVAEGSNWYRISFETGAVEEVLSWGKKIEAVQPREYKIQLDFVEVGAKKRAEDNNGMLDCIGALSGDGVLKATVVAENDKVMVVMSPAKYLIGAQLLENDTVEMTFSGTMDLTDLTVQIVLHGTTGDTLWNVGSIAAKAGDANTLVGKAFGVNGASAYEALYNMGSDESMEVRICSEDEAESGDDDAWVKEDIGLVSATPSETARDAATAELGRDETFSVTQVELMADTLIDVMGGAESDKGRTLLLYFNSQPDSIPTNDKFEISFVDPGDDYKQFNSKHREEAVLNTAYDFGGNPIAVTLKSRPEATLASIMESKEVGTTVHVNILSEDGTSKGAGEYPYKLEDWKNIYGFMLDEYYSSKGSVYVTPAAQLNPLALAGVNLYEDNQVRIKFTQPVEVGENVPFMEIIATANDGTVTTLGRVDESTLAYYGNGKATLSATVIPTVSSSKKAIIDHIPDGSQLGFRIISEVADSNSYVDEIYNSETKLQSTMLTFVGDQTGDIAYCDATTVAGSMPIAKDIVIWDTVEFLSQSQMLITLSEAVDFTATKANILLVNDSNQIKVDENGKPYVWSGVLTHYGEVKSRLVFTFGGTKGNSYGNVDHPYDGMDELFNSGLDSNGYKFVLCLSDSAKKADGTIGTITSESGNMLLSHGYLAGYGDVVYLTINKADVPQGELKLEKIEIIDDMRAVATFSAPIEIVHNPFIAIRLFSQSGGLIWVNEDGKFMCKSQDPDTKETNTAMQWRMKWEYANAEQTKIYLYPNAEVYGMNCFSDIISHNWKETILANCTSDITDVSMKVGFEEVDGKTFTALRGNLRVDNIRMKDNEGVALTALTLGGYDGAFIEASVHYTPQPFTIKSAKVINELQILVTFSSRANIAGNISTALRYVNEDNSVVKYGEAPNTTDSAWAGTWKWVDESHTSIIWTMNGYSTFGANNLSDIINLRKAMSAMPGGGTFRFCIEEMNVKDVITFTPRNGVVDNITDVSGKNHLRANRSASPDGYFVNVDLSPFKGNNGVDLISAKAVNDQCIELTFSEGVLIADDETAPKLELRYRSMSGETEALANGKYAIFKGDWSYKDENKNVIVWKLNSKNAKSLTDIFNFNGTLRWNNTADVVFAIENEEEMLVPRSERLFGITSLDGYRLLNVEFSKTPSLILEVEVAYDKPEPEVKSDSKQEVKVEQVTNYLPFVIGGGVAVAASAAAMIVLIAKKKEEK